MPGPIPVPAPLRVGVVLRASAGELVEPALAEEQTRARLKLFCHVLGKVIGVDARGRIAADYGSLFAAMRNREVDLAWLPPVIAFRASAAGSALPIAMPVRDGVAAFHTALFARAGSPFRRSADLQGVRAAWVDRQSASGYLIVRAALRAQGVSLDQAFSEEHVLGSHVAVVEAVREGRVDVGATYIHQGKNGRWAGSWGSMAAHIIVRVGPIPNDVIAVGVHVPVEQMRTIHDALLEHPELRAAAAELLEAENIVHADSSHLEELIRLMAYLDNPDAGRRRSPLRGETG